MRNRIALCVVLLLSSCAAFSQKDSTKTDLSFDLGFTRDRNINFWPILKQTKSKDDKDLQILFPFFRNHHIYKESRKNARLIPLFFSDSSASRRDLRLFSFYYPSLFHYHNDKINHSRSYSFFELAPEINLLEFERSNDGLLVQNNLFFFLWYKNNKVLDKSHLVVFPLYWSYHNRCRTTSTLFPLYWNVKSGTGENQTKTNVFFPLYYGFKNKHYNNKILFPFLWSFKDDKYASVTMPPVFSYGYSRLNGNHHLMLTPLFWHNKRAGQSITNVIPLWYHKKKGEGELSCTSDVLFPFYWSYRSKDRNNQIIFPFVWKFKEKNYESVSLMPIFSIGHSRDNERKHFAITPFFWHIEKRNATFDYFFPILWKAKRGKDLLERKSTVLFPLYWFYKSSHYNNHILFPLIWSLKNKQSESFTFMPFFSTGHSLSNSTSHFAITPFIWHFKRKDGYVNTLFPIIWNTKRTTYGGNTKISDVIFPFLWYYKSKDKRNLTLFPILWDLKNEHSRSFTFLPVFSFGETTNKRKNHIMITPLFWHFKRYGTITNALFPIWWNRIDTIGKTVSKSNLVFPVFYASQYGRDKSMVFFPLFWSNQTENSSSFTFFPLFSFGYSKTKEHQSSYHMITPLYWNFRKDNAHRNLLFPLYHYYAKPTGVRKFSILYFLFRYSRDTISEKFNFLWPICEYEKGSGKTYFHFAPLVWYKRTVLSHYFSVQPFYYHSGDQEKTATHILWELFVYRNQLGVKRSHNILWKAFYWDRFSNRDFETRLFYLLYANVKKEGNVEKSLFPIYYISRQANGNRTLSLFFYFYNSVKRQVPDTREFYQERRIFWFLRILSNKKALEAKGIKVKR